MANQTAPRLDQAPPLGGGGTAVGLRRRGQPRPGLGQIDELCRGRALGPLLDGLEKCNPGLEACAVECLCLLFVHVKILRRPLLPSARVGPPVWSERTSL